MALVARKYRALGVDAVLRQAKLRGLDATLREEIRVVSEVYAFRVNQYIVDELIEWTSVPDDPIFRLTFPARGMLPPEAYARIKGLLDSGARRGEIEAAAREIRLALNPHPAEQLGNIPSSGGQRLAGVHHKYRETLRIFPASGQTCHAYCSYCFRWPQFISDSELELSANAVSRGLIDYLHEHREITDVAITGGDPMVMRAHVLQRWIDGILAASAPGLCTLRISTKALSYWPYRFVSDEDSLALLTLLSRTIRSGLHVAVMAHVSHPRELTTPVAREAISRLRATGCTIRTQAPVARGVNADPDVWATMIREQVRLGMVPYYMFIGRDTGAQRYFAVPLARALEIYRGAIRQVSGLGRTLRGPVIAAALGDVEVLDVIGSGTDQRFALRYLQARDPELVADVFFARYDSRAIWFDELEPVAGSERFFFPAALAAAGRQEVRYEARSA